jgi:hypothetical protein
MPYGTINADLMTTSDAVSSSGLYGFKNRIINGAMVIDQRNAGASITPTNGQYSVDRYKCLLSQASKYSAQQNAGSVTPPVGFSNYLGITSSSAYSVVAGDYFALQQPVEGFNTADLGWGTANAKTITISFQVYSSLTGTFGGSIINSATNRSYPFTYTISSANTWTTASITIAGDTSGTWVGATNGVGMYVIFGLGVGSTYSGTAGSWSSNYYFSATGATSVVGTNGATFYITGVQLEKGSTATSFDYRPYGTELQLCQRYYQVGSSGAVGKFTSTTNLGYGIVFPIPMRSTPTVSHTANYSAVDLGVADVTITNTTINGSRISTTGAALNGTTTGATSGAIGIVFSNGTGFSSEL